MKKVRYKLVLSYDGTAYGGWQVQKNNRTIQQEVEKAIETVCGVQVRLHSSGRTDAGVHARAQVAHVDLDREILTDKLQHALNSLLDQDVRIQQVASVKSDFHARFDAVRKEYRYFIWNADIMPPFKRLYYLHVRKKLNVSAMQEAADLLTGKNDFASFSANPKREVDGTVRTLFDLSVKTRGREIVLCAVGDGFLYKMVRSLTGYLLRVGSGDVEPGQTRAILNERKRKAVVPTAAPHGLFLWRVSY